MWVWLWLYGFCVSSPDRLPSSEGVCLPEACAVPGGGHKISHMLSFEGFSFLLVHQWVFFFCNLQVKVIKVKKIKNKVDNWPWKISAAANSAACLPRSDAQAASSSVMRAGTSKGARPATRADYTRLEDEAACIPFEKD